MRDHVALGGFDLAAQGRQLGDFLVQVVDRNSFCRIALLLQAGEPLLHGFIRQRHRPTVVARQVAAVPLGPNAVDLADQAAPNRIHRVVVQDAVVPLVARGQDLVVLLGKAGHLLALVNAVPHQLLGEHVLAGRHGLDRHRRVQVQRQRDHHGLHVLVGQQVVVVLVVDLHVFAGFVFALPVVLRHQPAACVQRAFAGVIAVESAMDVVRADIRDGHDLDVAGRDRAEQHVAFVASADHADAQRILDRGLVAKVHRAQTHARNGSGGDARFEEVAPGDADRAFEVFLADGFFFRTQVHRSALSTRFFPRLAGVRKNPARTSAQPRSWPAPTARTFPRTDYK